MYSTPHHLAQAASHSERKERITWRPPALSKPPCPSWRPGTLAQPELPKVDVETVVQNPKDPRRDTETQNTDSEHTHDAPELPQRRDPFWTRPMRRPPSSPRPPRI